VQPFLGTICAMLIVSNIRLESIDLIVGSSKLIARGSKLIRQFMSHFSFRPRIFIFRSIRDNGFDSSHRTLPKWSLGLEFLTRAKLRPVLGRFAIQTPIANENRVSSIW
jgi:hypothetical protein